MVRALRWLLYLVAFIMALLVIVLPDRGDRRGRPSRPAAVTPPPPAWVTKGDEIFKRDPWAPPDWVPWPFSVRIPVADDADDDPSSGMPFSDQERALKDRIRFLVSLMGYHAVVPEERLMFFAQWQQDPPPRIEWKCEILGTCFGPAMTWCRIHVYHAVRSPEGKHVWIGGPYYEDWELVDDHLEYRGSVTGGWAGRIWGMMEGPGQATEPILTDEERRMRDEFIARQRARRP